MWLKFTCLLFAWVAPLLAREHNPDEWAARLAHARIDPTMWAQVILVENDRPTRDYPAQTWATVFELEERLWIYLPREGTRSLSRFEGRLESDKADLRDVLAAVHAGFGSYRLRASDDDNPDGARNVPLAPLPNGCLIDAVTRFHRLRVTQKDVQSGFLLMYYGGRLARWGHTVLCFQTPDGWFCWDSKFADRLVELGPVLPRDALRVARLTVDPRMVAQVTEARILPMRSDG